MIQEMETPMPPMDGAWPRDGGARGSRCLFVVMRLPGCLFSRYTLSRGSGRGRGEGHTEDEGEEEGG